MVLSVSVHSCCLLLDYDQFAWFMDLTFQVPMQCRSLQPRTLAFTTRCIHVCVCILLWPSCFILSGTISNCPLLFHSSILDTFWPGSGVGRVIFWCHIFLPFHTVHGVLEVRLLQWVANPSSSGLHFVRTLRYDPSVLGSPASHGS